MMNWLQSVVARVFGIKTGEKVRSEIEAERSCLAPGPPPTLQELIAEMMPDRGTHSDEVIQDAIDREIGNYTAPKSSVDVKSFEFPKGANLSDGRTPGEKRALVFSEWVFGLGLAGGGPIDLNRRVTWGGDCYLDFTVNRGNIDEARIIRWILKSDPMWLAAESVGVPLLTLENTETVTKPDGTTVTHRLQHHEILKQLKVLDDEDFVLIDQKEKIFSCRDFKNA